MHASSHENMSRCVAWYLPSDCRRVIDLGSSDVNGSYRPLFPSSVEYIGFDLEPGPGVDIVLSEPERIPLADNSIDVVISGQMLEHCPHFWIVIAEIARVLRPGGMCFLIAPSAGPVHRYPVDCYRFHPDAYQALAQWAALRLVHCWKDDRGPWCDTVGVFQKGGNVERRTAPPEYASSVPIDVGAQDRTVEKINGQVSYLDALKMIHALVKPKLYVEIGVRNGKSLRLSTGDSIGIDPHPEVLEELRQNAIYPGTSDDFFFFAAEHGMVTRPVDFAFIDGMHRIENVYRDFMNLERIMDRNGVIVIDDVLPNHPLQASRDRQTRVWCGDVWRIVPLLRTMRPDLKLTLLDTSPSGLLVICKLDPSSRRMQNQYNATMRMLSGSEVDVPRSVLARQGAVAPTADAVRAATSR